MLVKYLKQLIKEKTPFPHLKNFKPEILDLDPLHALYDNSRSLFFVHIAKCIDRVGRSFDQNSNHPFIKTLISIESQDLDVAATQLYDYYHDLNPVDMNELFSLKEPLNTQCDSISLHPHSSFILPWEGFERVSQNTLLYGPADKDYCRKEVQRLADLLDSIKTNGYNPRITENYIRGYLLINNRDYRFVVKGGQHRIAVLSYLGFDTVIATWQPYWHRTVYKKDASIWPQVVNGTCNRDVASIIFDSMF